MPRKKKEVPEGSEAFGADPKMFEARGDGNPLIASRQPTVKMTSEALKTADEKPKKKKALAKEVRKPGALVGYSLKEKSDGSGAWYPWTYEDLAQEMVQWVCQEIPDSDNIQYRTEDYMGERKYYLFDLNNVKLLIQIGAFVRTPAAFFHLWKNMMDQAIEARRLRFHGPDHALWSHGNFDQNTWHYEPAAISAWLDIDGRYIHPDKYYLITDDGVPIPIEDFKNRVIGPGFPYTKEK